MKKRSLFFKFFMALTLLAAVPMIVITTIMSYAVMRYSENEISKSYIGKLKVAGNFTQMIAQNIYMGALKITMDGYFDQASYISSYDSIFENQDDMMSVYYIQESIINLTHTNNILHSIYLFPENADYLVTSNRGLVRLDEFPDKGWLDGYRKFKEYKSEPAWMSTRMVSYSENGAKGTGNISKVITFFYTFTPYTTTAKGTFILNIHEKELRNLINTNSFITEGYIMIINNKGDIISHIKDELVGSKLSEDYLDSILENSETEGYIINKSGSVRQLVTYYKSDFNNWIYIGIFPMDVLTGKISSLMMQTIYICFAFISSCILVSFIVSKKVSSPLDKLIQSIRINKGIDIKSNDSELAILSKAFDHILREEAKLFSILENSRKNNRDSYLLNLLQGKSTEGYTKEITGVEFVHDSFVCAVILIDRYYDFINAFTHEQQEYMKTLVLKVSEELIGKEFACAGVLFQKQKIAFIINYNSNSAADIGKRLKIIFSRVQEQVSKVMDFTISVGIGNKQTSAASVAESFDKALEALKYKMMAGHGSINFWKDVNYGEATYYYPYSIEKHLLNMISSGITDKLEATVTELINEIRRQEFIQYENLMQVFIQLTTNTVKLLLDQHLSVSMIFGSSYNMYQILSRKETLDEIKEWLIEMFTKIAGYIEGVRYKNKSYFDRALDYIHENYKKDIDINTIAENIGLSYSYLRKVFKEETGENIISYINRIRIDESKHLLSQTGMTIKEIALALGYNNEQSFVRYFKKFENMSPGEYRQSRRAFINGRIAANAGSMYNR